MTQFAEEWHSQIVPLLFPAQPCSCCCGVSKLPALLDVKGGEAGQEKLERSLGIAQLEGGQLEAGLKFLGIYKDLIFVPLFPFFNRTKVLPWDTPWGHQNAGDLRASSLREISSGFLYLLEMFKHLDILLGYPTEILQNLALGVSQGHRAHCWWLPQFWDQPSMCIPFPCASTLNLLFPAAPSAVGCQEEEIPCDVNAGIAWLGLGTCVLPARLSGIGGYSEQRLCVPFTHKNPLNPFHQLHKSNLGALHVLR